MPNEQIIIDPTECFVFTEMCGTKACSSVVQKGIQHYMKKLQINFITKNIPLYKLLIDTMVHIK